MPLFIKVGSIPESRSSLSHSRTLMLLPESGAFSTIRTRRGRSAPSAVGARLVGYQQLRREALFLEQLAHQPQRCAFVAPALNQHDPALAGAFVAPALNQHDPALAGAFVARWCIGYKVETAGGALRVRED